ncbi:MAG: hypothetical protein KKH02_05045 [Proteobacteria bacterium]|nr:hypothetical protein [Pseudomonadota bacterium]MCG2738707.1 hypothetical protein [Syntrophaceae bacterium]MBU1743337.1 hypothetical protein [Pseudomonadota bacterium]MBU1964620.1 hypothetical protein [Pseudomonadota bacterium]MBU4372685.1 hypothetical protein [Pseudomonadota bacterium]
MEYIRTVDFAAIDKSGADERLTQRLFDHTVHLAFNTPQPDPDLPFAKSV